MNRKDFLKTGSLLSAAIVLPATDSFSKNMADNSIDKIVDANGNYIQQALPYNENNLEPYMDAETLHLHYKGCIIQCRSRDTDYIPYD